VSDTDPRESNPNASGPQGLKGDMGISSERTGPFGSEEPADQGVEGTGSHGSAAEKTEGTMSTERQHPQDPAEGARDIGGSGADSAPSPDGPGGAQAGGTESSSSEGTEESDDEEHPDNTTVRLRDPNGPEMDDTQQDATQGWRDGQEPAGAASPSGAGTHRSGASTDQRPDVSQAESTDTEMSDDEPYVDRTVGEANTAEVPSQDFDRTRNPGHSHG
jgi:hypothetical protein